MGIGKMHFTNDKPALMLKYQTALSIDELAALQSEVDEVWSVFKVEVEKAQMESAIISANEPSTGGFVSKNRARNFVFKREGDGTWKQLSEASYKRGSPACGA